VIIGNRRQDDFAVSERYPQFAKIRLCKMQEYPQIDITGGEDITTVVLDRGGHFVVVDLPSREIAEVAG
jgi:hypothetical protein